MLKTGEYVREKGSGQLYQVQFDGIRDLCTIRMSDHAHVHLNKEDVIQVVEPSPLPGEPETTRRAA